MCNIVATQYGFRFIGSEPIKANNVIGTYSRYLGQRQYELTNHLGNVLATVADYKTAETGGQAYTALVSTAQDYDPFGMLLPGRNYSNPLLTTSKYRYGFNGKENDNEVEGSGNWQDYGMRMYSPRLVRFPSVDPLSDKYPYYTPYQFAGNMPIRYVDLDGMEPTEPGKYKGQGAVDFQRDKDDCDNVCEGTECYKWVWDNNTWKNTDKPITTNDELKSLFPNANNDNLITVETTINLNGSNFGIKDNNILAHYLAQAGHETGGFKNSAIIESLYYTTIDRVLKVFGSKSNIYKKVSADPNKYLKNSENFANAAYANIIGNGDEASGDGFKFRGRGYFQLTGRGNYQNFTDSYNSTFGTSQDFVVNPDKVATDNDIAIKSSLWYFHKFTVPSINNGSSFKSITKTVNAGAVGLTERKMIYQNALNVLNH